MQYRLVRIYNTYNWLEGVYKTAVQPIQVLQNRIVGLVKLVPPWKIIDVLLGG